MNTNPYRGEVNSNSCPPPLQGGVRGGLVLVDFGAAKYVTATGGETGTTIGSAGYAAPEQTVGKAVVASDIYSLGVTCIHLLTGMEPFDLYDASESKFVWRNYLIDNPVSAELSRILDKMLEVPLKNRYKSADEVLQDLNSLVSQRQTPVLQLYQQQQGRSNLPANLNSHSFFHSAKSWLAAGMLVMLGWGGHQYWRLTRWNLEENTDRIGADYSNTFISKPDPDLCKQICAVDEQCQAFTYVRPGIEGDRARCYFKNGVPSPSLREGRSSSVRPRW
ncbi:MAG: hypothetical protein HC786_02070 [Richelia sp. CSU_2_1]|nr:hypothetical protein [Richelia sp. CSU_2_1]